MSSFHLDEMYETLGIDGYLTFLQNLAEKYHFKQNISQRIQDAIRFVNKKRNDKNVYVSVIGDFNNGKSTFINALLHECLLDSSVIPAYTAASTMISYGQRLSVTAVYKDGRREIVSVTDSTKEQVLGFLKKYTTEELSASQLAQVEIQYPSDVLKEGLVIIDTPGINATTRWHEDVTRRVIREVSDISLVVFDMNHAMTETLQGFVAENLSEVLDHCLFIGTKADMIPTSEREDLLIYARQVISKALGVKSPTVLPYSSLHIIEENITDCDPDILALSCETEREIIGMIPKCRVSAQIKKLAEIIDTTFDSISREINEQSSFAALELLRIQKRKKQRLSVFLGDKQEQSITAFTNSVKKTEKDVENTVELLIAEAKKSITAEFEKCSSGNDLVAFEKSLSDLVGKKKNTIIDAARKKYNQGGIAGAEIRKFWSEFKYVYSEFGLPKIENDTTFRSQEAKLTNITASTDALKKALCQMSAAENDARDIAAGLGVVAAVGVGIAASIFLGPIIGVGAGSLVRAATSSSVLDPVKTSFSDFAKGLVGAKLNAYKEKCRPLLKTALESYFTNIKSVIVKECDNYSKRLLNQIKGEMNRCLSLFEKEVNTMIAKNEAQQKKIDALMSDLKKDLDSISIQKRLLASIRMNGTVSE